MNKSFEDNFDSLMKGIDKSKNRLVAITDRNGVTKKVWKHIETSEEKQAGKNAGKSYEKTGQRHTSFNGFNSGDLISFIVSGKEIGGTFRHVNQSKHSTVAVVRGDDGKLYERSLNKISKKEKEPTAAQEAKEHTKTFNKIKQDVSKDGKLDTTKKEFGQDIKNDHNKKDGLDVFRNIVKTAKDLKHAFELISKMKNVKPEISQLFREKYGKNGERPVEAFENFYNEVKGIIKPSLHVETQKLDKKKNPNFGGKKEDNFTDVVSKTTWQRGDSVSFLDKNGKEKMGRVVKVDKEMNMTTVRQSNGMTETISNKKIKI